MVDICEEVEEPSDKTGLKQCRVTDKIGCGQWKPRASFSKMTKAKDGLQLYCNDCHKKHYTENKEQILAKQKVYNENNKEHRAEVQKVYNETHREEILANKRGYYVNNREQMLEDMKERYVEKREQKLEYAHKYRKDNIDQVRKTDRDRWVRYPEKMMWRNAKARVDTAKRKGIIIPFDITVEDIFIPTHCPVPHCGVELERIEGKRATSPSLDKIIPINGYTKDNLNVICYGCNARKNDTTIDQFYSFGGFYEDLRDKDMTFTQHLDRVCLRWSEA